jgi:hypothetical protein
MKKYRNVLYLTLLLLALSATALFDGDRTILQELHPEGQKDIFARSITSRTQSLSRSNRVFRWPSTGTGGWFSLLADPGSNALLISVGAAGDIRLT